MEKKGLVVSDLHLLTNRTTINFHIHGMERAAAQSDLFILNGDIFDFKWSLHGDVALSLDVAREWIETLVRPFPHCRFVFMIGNHDSLTPYMELLDHLAGRHANIGWDKYWLQVEDKVFLHGDAADAFMTPAALDLHRMRWDRLRQMPRIWHSIYGAATRYSPHWIVPQLKSKRLCANRLIHYLRAALGAGFYDIQDIYFGHLHSPFTDFTCKGIRFHNTGAAIHGLRLRMLPFTFNNADLLCSRGHLS